MNPLPFTTFADVQQEYLQDANLKEEDVKSVMEWVRKKPHLPEINEIQAIAFLKKAHYRINAVKTAIDSYFTLKKLWPDLLAQKNLKNPPLEGIIDSILITFLPKQTPEGYKIIFMDTLSPDIINYSTSAILKYVDIVLLTELYQKGTYSYKFVFDAERFPYEYLAKFDWLAFKRYFYYLQEILPVEFKELHYINPPPHFDQVMSIVEGAVPKSVLSQVYVHQNLDDLDKHVSRDVLPKDYGGSADSKAVLHERSKNELLGLDEVFEWENQQAVDESKRPSNKSGVFDFENRVKKFE